MKKKFGWISTILLIVGLVFCFVGCGEQEFTPSGSSGDTESLTLNFNGGKLFGNSSVKFSSEDIENVVGMPIETALVYLNFGIDKLQKNDCIFEGWTLTKNGDNLVRYLPEYGTLYAKWQSLQDDNNDDSNEDDNNDNSGDNTGPLSLTLDFNGGTMNGESSITLTTEQLEMYIGLDYAIAINTLSVLTSIPTKNDGSTFVGFATTRNGTPGEPWTIPESGSHTLYAIYM